MQSFSRDIGPSAGTDADAGDDDGASGGNGEARDMFVTETMAELSARQGRSADAAAIYRRLLAGAAAGDGDARSARWRARLAMLEGAAAGVGDRVESLRSRAAAPGRAVGAPLAPARGAAPASAVGPATLATIASPTTAAGPAASRPRMAMLVDTPVRSGQIVYAEGRDLIVLAPVNPGAQLMADGHIHVYGPLRGRAVAGVRGATDAQIFCHRLEAELVGIDAAYVPADGLPTDLVGRAVRIWLAAGLCRFSRM